MAVLRRPNSRSDRGRRVRAFKPVLAQGELLLAPSIASGIGVLETIGASRAGTITPAVQALPARPVYEACKRALDIVVSLVALLLLAPVFALTALAIRLNSPGSVFYRQERLGKDGVPFTMLKFRSMYERDVDVPPELLLRNESTGPLFKMRHDPRVTRVGRIIRKTSIDELPQLMNVLMGQMSLVGPRPPLPRELEGYEVSQLSRLRVTPGITGPWQVSGRSTLTFDDMVHLDLNYIDERSILLDVKLLLLTIPTVVLGRGAY